jgi:hypothetical protein
VSSSAAETALPPRSLVRKLDTHRLIPTKYTRNDDSVLTLLADDERHLQDLFDLDNATNDRLQAEGGRALGIGPHELVFGVPYYRIVNAAFTHAHPLGSRFNGPERGAWYAAFELETSLAEVSFHKTLEYVEINRFDDSVQYDDYLADISAELDDLRVWLPAAPYLSPESYVLSQRLAEQLLSSGSLGIVFPSVRRSGGTCVCCFRPAIVSNVRRSGRYRLTWSGTPEPTVSRD